MEWTIFSKIISIFLTFIVCFVGAIIPLRFSYYFNNPKILSRANCLSAGILLGASLIHLLFDGEEISFNYPFAHLFGGIGFLITLILEKICFIHNHEHDEEENDHQIELKNLKNDENKMNDNDNKIENEKLLINTIEENVIEEYHVIKNTKKFSQHPTGYILLTVLSLESFISGSALGVSQTYMKVFVLLTAILTHIWAESFALCATFIKSHMEKNFLYKIMFLFSWISPLGIIIGMSIHQIFEGKIAIIISLFLISIAAGTFLYISIVEIISEEFKNSQDKWMKLFLLLIGFSFMSILAILF